MPPDPPRASGGALGVAGAAVAMAACCAGLPLLLGVGITVGATGILTGSILLISAGVVVGLWAWRRRARAAACEPTTVLIDADGQVVQIIGGETTGDALASKTDDQLLG